jgi:phosphatidate cytidylyltransferase
MLITHTTQLMFGGILAGLVLATMLVSLLKRTIATPAGQKLLKILSGRIGMWWAMCGVFTIAAMTRGIGSILMFALTSFLLLREFITITPTRKADHHTCFWAFFVFLPLQYYLLWTGWYGLFIILIPVYAFLFVPLRTALSGDSQQFMERTAKIQWALMICVYCISHAPGLLKINFEDGPQTGLRLLLYLCLIVQINDIIVIMLQSLKNSDQTASAAEKIKGAYPAILAGILISGILAGLLGPATPFNLWQSVVIGMLTAAMGSAGNICYVAMVADRGKPGVVVVQTRPSATSRLISLCFAAPVFFHITRYYFTTMPSTGF